MSVEDVTVSLSRLALAKAIKSSEQDPWSDSVIFHQSHITPHMRNSILHPQRLPKQPTRPNDRRRPSLPKPRPSIRAQTQTTTSPSLHFKTRSSTSSLTTNNKRAPVPSDDESEVESEEEAEESDDPDKIQSAQPLKTPDITCQPPTLSSPLPKGKHPVRNTEHDLPKIEQQQPQRNTNHFHKTCLPVTAPTTNAIPTAVPQQNHPRRLSTLRHLDTTTASAHSPTHSFTQDTTSTISSSVSEDLIEEPIFRVSNYPARPMTELDMYNSYCQQHQWAFALQMQQQQQMIHMAHQQIIQMAHYQHYSPQPQPKPRQRQSLSGIDLLLQKEQQRLTRLGQPKKKLYPDPSKAALSEGLLGQINPQKHTLSVQQQQQRPSRQPRFPSSPAGYPFPTSLSTPLHHITTSNTTTNPPTHRRLSHFNNLHKH